MSFKLKAAIYARVSTAEQAEGKVSIPDQISKSQKIILEKGWELIGNPYIDSGISGHLLEERKGLQRLLDDARNHLFDIVVVTDFDRFARNRAAATIVREELKELLIQTYAINTPVEPKDPRTYDPTDDDLAIMVEGFSDAQSEIERNKIRRRMMMGKVAVAKAGKIPNNVPYGYKIKRSFDSKGKVIRDVVVDPDEARIIKRIYEEYIGGKGMLQIAYGLTKDGIKPPRAEYWRQQAIKYILRNETYTGKVLWGWRHAEYKKNVQRKLRDHKGIIEKGSHEAIISEQQFKLAQREKEIRGNSQKGRAQISRGLLTGIAKCIRCGSGVSYITRHHKRKQINPNWNDTTTHEYLCGGYKYSGICQRRVMSGEKLESFVLSQVKNLINNPIAKEKLLFDRSIKIEENLKDDFSRSKKIVDDIPRKRQKQQEAYEAGLITMEEYGLALQRLREDEEKYRVVMDEYKFQDQQLKERDDDIQKFIDELSSFDVLWENANLEEKKHFLRAIIKEIRAGNGKIEIDFRF